MHVFVRFWDGDYVSKLPYVCYYVLMDLFVLCVACLTMYVKQFSNMHHIISKISKIYIYVTIICFFFYV